MTPLAPTDRSVGTFKISAPRDPFYAWSSGTLMARQVVRPEDGRFRPGTGATAFLDAVKHAREV